MGHLEIVSPERVAATSGYDVQALRRAEFPWADETIYLNHAATGPLPERTRIALEQYGRVRASAYGLGDEHLFGVLRNARALAARLIGAEADEISLATNTSYGIHIAALSLPLGPGDRVLVTQREFPANVFPWRELGRKGVELEMLPQTSRGWPDEASMIERLADPRVKVLALSHVQFQSGYRADLARLSEACRANGAYLVVDAIQTLGQIPFDVRETPVDILACGAQKWLLSPWGSGFAYVRRGLIEALEPPFAGWMSFEDTDDFSAMCSYQEQRHRDARRFEMVTLPFQDFVGMIRSIELLLELGIDAIERHLAAINRPVLEWAERRGVPLASPTGRHGSGMVCLVPPEAGRVFAELTAAGVVASYREGAIRLSPHCYNTIDEMSRVADLLERAIS